MDENGIVIKNKARLVAQGNNQHEGIDYKETFTPVARLEGHQDISCLCSLHGFYGVSDGCKECILEWEKISEEVYVQQPPGFESSEYPNHVCKLDKALYGLKQPLSMKESLMYLTASRPDIQFSTCLCARYQANPKESHLVAVKRIFSSVAMSSVEAEYVVVAGCCAQVLWIKCQLADYDVLYDKVPIFYDNTSVIAISNNPVLHSRIKHIDIRYHLIRDHILKGYIELHFVPTDLQLANIFTKPLVEPSFTRLVAELASTLAEEQGNQPSAAEAEKTKKKRIPPSSKPKSSYKVKVILIKKQVAKTQQAEVTEAITDATKSLVASELAEEQGNQPLTAKALDKNIEEEVKDIGFVAMEEVTFEQIMDEVDSKARGAQENEKDVEEGDASESLFGLRSMPNDDLASISGFKTQDSADHVSKVGIDTLHTFANNSSQSDPVGHLHAE
ncbi:retrovirus-related pol polyprotein from transposon TNT 1-94 [Tanacetum coccineum]